MGIGLSIQVTAITTFLQVLNLRPWKASQECFLYCRNKFDLFVAMVGVVELLPFVASGGPLLVLRLMRVLRLFRLTKSFPRLRAIIEVELPCFPPQITTQ